MCLVLNIVYSIPSDRICDVLLVVPFDFQTNSLWQRDSQNVFEPDSEKHLDTHHSHILGHWTEPYTIVIIGRRGHRCHFCLDKHFVVTTVCCNKHMFVGTKHVFCHNKSMLTVTKLLSQQNYVCHDKIFLMWFFFFCWQIFVLTNTCLLLQQMLCDNKHTNVNRRVLSWRSCVCHDKTFVATKMIPVPAPALNTQSHFRTVDFDIHTSHILALWMPVASFSTSPCFGSADTGSCTNSMVRKPMRRRCEVTSPSAEVKMK